MNAHKDTQLTSENMDRANGPTEAHVAESSSASPSGWKARFKRHRRLVVVAASVATAAVVAGGVLFANASSFNVESGIQAAGAPVVSAVNPSMGALGRTPPAAPP